MNEKEKEFKESILKKIEKYNIKYNGKKCTLVDCLRRAKNKFVVAHYNNGDPDEIIDIGIEKFLYQCSPLLFLSKYCTFNLPGIGDISCENLYYFQKEILKDFLNYKKIVLTKSRQTGMSTLMSLIFFWKAVNFSNEWLLIISKDGKSSSEFLEKIKLNLKNIPVWFGLEVEKNNIKGLVFSNKTKIDSFARSKDAGRGCTGTMCVCDEFAFYQTEKIAEGIISSVVPSLSRVGGQLFLISTPNGTQGEGKPYYKQVENLRQKGGVDGTAKLYSVDWWEVLDGYNIKPEKGFNEKVQSYIDRDYFNNPSVKLEAEKFFRPIAENPSKNEWLNYQFSTSGEVKYRQEILQDFVVLGNSVFNKEIIEKAQTKLKSPIIENNCDGKNIKGFWIWQKPLPDHKYLLSADVSKGSGDDSSAVQVIDMHTYEQVAEYVGKCTTIDLANYIYDIGCYYNFAYSVIECNSIGEAVFNELFYNLNYPNLYKQIKNKNGIDVATGWMTSMKSREIITNNIIQMYYDDEMWKYYMPHSSRLLEQMKTWIWKGGKPDHLDGGHDDTIMAMAIGLFNIADGIKKIRKPEDIIFYDENGNGINILDKKEESFTDNYLCSNLTNGKELPESVYKSAERQMYQNAGINPEDEDAASRLKWLLS